MASVRVLYEDNHCLAVGKPAGVATTHGGRSELTVDQLAKDFLKQKYRKPGRVFLGIVHRLDKPVSGVLLFARTSKAAARLSQQFREHAVEKVYWAVVSPRSQSPAGTRPLAMNGGEFHLDDWLIHDDNAMMVRAATPSSPGAVAASTVGRVLARDGETWLIELRPKTGRKHQLRVQLASRGWPIVGDRKYGSRRKFPQGIALHAVRLNFRHPVRDETIRLHADPPETWTNEFGRLLHLAKTR
ncbi:MAG: RluA family pseudouridine synthase [Gemmataceae bacterium]|nr:RluA family pseudouridine synthase [Gemmataceae bacterium]